MRIHPKSNSCDNWQRWAQRLRGKFAQICTQSGPDLKQWGPGFSRQGFHLKEGQRLRAALYGNGHGQGTCLLFQHSTITQTLVEHKALAWCYNTAPALQELPQGVWQCRCEVRGLVSRGTDWSYQSYPRLGRTSQRRWDREWGGPRALWTEVTERAARGDVKWLSLRESGYDSSGSSCG